MKRWTQAAGNRAGKRSGNVMLEFALGSAVLIAALTGTFEFGYTFLQYNNLLNAVARGARYASLVPYDSASSTPSVAFTAAVRNMVLYGSPAPGASPALRGLTPENVNLTVTFAGGIPSTMTVSISGYPIDSVFGVITLSNKPRVTYAYQGIWTPI
ncbi:MAG TPA: TadE family protein [Armatimonadota bacterium]|jgi:Flp pilus assembly protein TadG